LLHAARAEGVRTLADCALRVRLGIGACQGAACAAPAAALLAEALDWSPERTDAEVAAFAAERWRAGIPILAGRQLAALEIHRHAHLAARGFAGANGAAPVRARGAAAAEPAPAAPRADEATARTLARWRSEPAPA